MNLRVAIYFRGRCLQDLGPDALCQTQHVDGAVNAGLGRLDRIELIMNRRCRTREIENLVDLDIERKADVVTHQLEPRVRQQVMHVLAGAGVEVIDAENFVTALQQPLAQMRADEAGAAGHENASFPQHVQMIPVLPARTASWAAGSNFREQVIHYRIRSKPGPVCREYREERGFGRNRPGGREFRGFPRTAPMPVEPRFRL